MRNIRIASGMVFVLFVACLPLQAQDDDNPARRREWFVEQRADPNGALPGHLRLKALAQMDSMIHAQAVRKTNGVAAVPNQWTSIGPQPTVGGYMTSGRVVALAVDPRNADLVYLGAADGGVWKTTDGGSTWTPLFDAQPSMSIGSLAIDPQNSSIVYVGTGEADNCQPCYYGAGLLKSIDGGATWTNIRTPFVDAVGRGSKIASIAVSPANGNIVLAAVNATSTLFQGGNFFTLPSGIFRSIDGGLTWSVVAGAGFPGSRVIFNPVNPQQAFAALSGAYGAVPSTGLGIFVSNDAGANWTPSNGTGANTISLAGAGRIELTLAPSSPNILYAAVSNDSAPPGDLLGFYTSADGGQSWSQLRNTPDYCRPQCWYGNTLAVDPTNPAIVFAGGLNLYRSSNGGASWTPVDASLHVDHHDLQFAAGGTRLYNANDGGVWSTTSPRATGVSWVNLNKTLAITQFYPGLSINPGALNIAVGGVQDNGTQLYNGTSSWQSTNACGDGGWTAIDTSLTTTMYSSCQNVPPIQIEKSLNSGASWTSVGGGIDSADGGRAAFIPPFVMDPSNPQRLYVGTYRLWQTSDGAGTWVAVSPDLTGGQTATLNPTLRAIAVAPSDPQTVYVGASTGLLWVTSKVDARDPTTYLNRSAGLPPRFVSQIQVDSTSASTAYVSYSGFTGLVASDTQGHIFRTLDSGATWLDISGNLPNIPVNDFALDPDLPGTIYAATDVGVFYTTNTGVSWNVLGTGLPRVVVLGLRLHRPTRTLRVATHGRGMWDIVVPLPPNQNPAPGIKDFSPSAAPVGAPDYNIVIGGAGFIPSSTIQWNGQPLPTQVYTTPGLGFTGVGATIPAAFLTQTTIARLTVVNPPPGGGVSNALSFVVISQPTISSGGVVNAASYGAPLVAGSLASVFGTGFSGSTAAAAALPLPVALNSVTVNVNFNPAPLIFISPQQINFQIPWEVAGFQQIPVDVNLAGYDSNQSLAPLVSAMPAIFTLNQQGSGPGAVLIANSALLAQPLSTPGARPVAKGDFISIFCTGLGAVTPKQISGQAAPSTPAKVLATVTASIGGQSATVTFAGLAPGFVGLYQVNAAVPPNAPSGNAVSLVLSVGNAVSNAVTIAVQ